MKPWAQGLFELIEHADEHAKAGTDFDRRMALISFDNSIELAIVTYLSLDPMQRDNQQFPREQKEKWLKNFHSKVEFLEHLVTSIFSQQMQVPRDEIIFYHRVRNEIYHGGSEMVPAEKHIRGIRAVALWVFNTLFKSDAESLLVASGDAPPAIHGDLQSDESSNQGFTPDLSAQTQFLDLFISMRHDIDMLMRISGGDKAAAASQSRTTEAWKTLFSSQGDRASKSEEVEEILEEAEALRSLIVEDQSLEATDSNVRDLSNDLAQVSDVVSSELEDLSVYLERVSEGEARLVAGAPADENERTKQQQARWLLAQLLEWHHREDKATWFEYFRLCELTDQELQEDKNALGGLVYVGVVGVVMKSIIHRYEFPLQDYSTDRFLSVHDPRTQRSVGQLVAIDNRALTIDIKRGASSNAPHPTALVPLDIINAKVLRESLLRLGSWVAENGIDAPGPFRAARDLLLRNPPRLRGNALRDLAAARHPTEVAVEVSLALDRTVLPIQGPPGSGKTHTGSRMIAEMVKNGLKVGVTAGSHKVISHLLERTCAAALETGVNLRAIQKLGGDIGRDDEIVAQAKSFEEVANALRNNQAQVAAGSVWLWARPEMADAVDVLFVDDAGQISLANVLAASQAAKSLVLLGDPEQLDKPQSGAHPPGADASALSHLLNGRATIEDGHGLFLAESWRLHPDVCAFTSEVFYDNRLVPRPENAGQRINSQGPLDGTGLRFLPVNHSGNRTHSPEEAEKVIELVEQLLRKGTTWTNKRGEVAPLFLKDILIVAPYNEQVSVLAQGLPARARVGTVDKFQGQEAPVVIYSMTTSTPEDAPRGIEFLYSSNRLNVATSRARCMTVLVASPNLFDVQCKAPRQIELANAFCQYLEMAKTI